MTDIVLMFKSLKLAWIPRLLSVGKKIGVQFQAIASEKWED